jgi:hypothetical protein
MENFGVKFDIFVKITDLKGFKIANLIYCNAGANR